MNSLCTAGFWEQFNALPEDIRRQALAAYKLWQTNPSANGLWFKQVQGKSDWWSVRVTKNYRALCIKDGSDCMWFFIGNHSDYDALI